MADFVQTMKDWRRMCQFMDKEYGNSSCDKCPLGGCSAVYEMCGKENFANMERDISAWAAEHPVPVYPTWEKYLADLMMLDMMCDKTDNPNSVENYMRKTPIPAEIAQKLGIEPKEGT
jgi:hypothetical protein